jgi:hypothetical protein
MTRLIWKEYREKRLWLPALAASVVGVVIAGQGYTYCGEIGAFTSWIALSLLSAFLLGAGAHSSELTGGTADLLYSRGASWKRALLSKLAVGAAMILLASALGAITYYFLRPEPLARFATFDRLALGFAYASLLMGAAYVVGFACSTALPGAFGGALTALGMAGVMAMHAGVLAQGNRREMYCLTGWTVGPVVAAIVTARFGLTLTMRERAIRYACIAVPVSIVVCQLWWSFTPTYAGAKGSRLFTSVSPDERYAVTNVQRWDQDAYTSDMYVMKLSDNSKFRVLRNAPNPHQFYWVDAGAAVLIGDTSGPPYVLRIAPGEAPLKKRATIRTLGYRNAWVIVPSPSRKLAIVAWGKGPLEIRPFRGMLVGFKDTWASTLGLCMLQVIDVTSGRRLGPLVESASDFWWQSDTEIGYGEKNGKRHIVRIVPPEAKK